MTSRRHILGWGAILLCWWAQPASAQQGRSASVTDPVRELIAAMGTNDADRIRAVFAEGASQAYGDAAPKAGPDFFRWLQSDIIDRKGLVENPQFLNNGDEVVVTGQFRNNAGYSSRANFLFRIKDGRIVSWQMRY